MMFRRLTLGALALFCAPPVVAGTAGAAGAELALKRVMLSTGGVGYFERAAEVDDQTTLTLEARRDQIDDVLKSLIVFDPAGGVAAITLPGEEPLKEKFRELPFPPEALASTPALLDALKGALIRVEGGRNLAGRVMAVAEETSALTNGTVTRHRVTVMTPDGLSAFILEEAEAVRFTDPRLAAELAGALAAVAQHSARDRRRLTINLTGQGRRRVSVGTVVAAPLWKASYRLTLPVHEGSERRTGAIQATLQGWAVLENMSGEDWREVEVTILSGNPVTLRQPLYAAYMVERPRVPVEVVGRVLPLVDEGAMTPDLKSDAAAPRAAPQAMRMAAPPPGGAPPPSMMGAHSPASAAPPPPAIASEGSTQVAFRINRPVSLADGESSLLPIIATNILVERVDIYQPSVQARHPLAAVHLTNTTGGGLPPGIVTLFEGEGEGNRVYLGDAQLPGMAADEQRFVSVAVDPKLTIDRREEPSRSITQARIADGVLTLTINERQTTAYTLQAAPGVARTVIIEHPRRPGWSLSEPAKANGGTTASAWRFVVVVETGATGRLNVVTETPRLEQVALSDLAPERIGVYAAAQELPADLRAGLGRLVAARAAEAERKTGVESLERAREQAVHDQDRLRQNLGALPHDSDLYKRTLARMGEDEAQIERADRDLVTARADAAAARQAVLDLVRALGQ